MSRTRPATGTTRTLGIFVALASIVTGAGCSQLHAVHHSPSAPIVLLPGSELLSLGSRLTDTVEYRWMRSPSKGETGDQLASTSRLETQAVTRDGVSELVLVLSVDRPGGPSVRDTSTVLSRGFAPRSEVAQWGPRHMVYAFDGPVVRRTIAAPDTAAGVREHQYDVPVFHFNEVTLLARALPFQRGFTAIVPLYSQGDDALERDTLSVLGPDSLGIWNVRFADRVIVGTYGVDPSTRRVVRYVSTSPQRPGWRVYWGAVSHP